MTAARTKERGNVGYNYLSLQGNQWREIYSLPESGDRTTDLGEGGRKNGTQVQRYKTSYSKRDKGRLKAGGCVKGKGIVLGGDP